MSEQLVSKAERPRVGAVIVSFHPDEACLVELIARLLPQTSCVVIVDNGSAEEVLSRLESEFPPATVAVLRLMENKGIAAAQNVGIEHLRRQACDYIAFFDHDSCPSEDMIEALVAASRQIEAVGGRVGLVAPVCVHEGSGVPEGFVRLGWLGATRIGCESGMRPEVDFAISSGSLVGAKTLDHVGLMNEDLFIDHVDTEWCFRAKAFGYRHFGVCDARMVHRLGDRRTRVWLLRWRTIPHHSAFRYYFIFRNSIALYRMSHMPLKWKASDLVRLAKLFLFFGVLSARRGACLKMMCRGVLDGVRGRLGGFPAAPARARQLP